MANDLISRQAAIDFVDDVPYIKDHSNFGLLWKAWVEQLPSAQPEWNNHTVACLLAEMFGEDCACNFNGIDEWLPEKCEVIESCPNPVGVACWEQFLKHRGERRQDE